jgi:hypothetical protein
VAQVPLLTPSQNIPFPLHLLWRLDTLLLNLGLTLILSAFYFDPAPIYHHLDSVPVHSVPVRTLGPEASHPGEPSRWLWLAWALVALLHVCVSLVWKVVGRVGVGAVTWGVSGFSASTRTSDADGTGTHCSTG